MARLRYASGPLACHLSFKLTPSRPWISNRDEKDVLKPVAQMRTSTLRTWPSTVSMPFSVTLEMPVLMTSMFGRWTALRYGRPGVIRRQPSSQLFRYVRSSAWTSNSDTRHTWESVFPAIPLTLEFPSSYSPPTAVLSARVSETKDGTVCAHHPAVLLCLRIFVVTGEVLVHLLLDSFSKSAIVLVIVGKAFDIGCRIC
jgi:hypothetical protein